jgi:glycosyltransferase involved in cell wall biosynthesis
MPVARDHSAAGGVLCVHLYDDFSGASKVCAQVAAVLERAGHRVDVLVGSAGSTGFVRSAFPGAATSWYRFSERRTLRAAFFAAAQVALFASVVRLCLARRPAVVWVNTLHPAAAVAAARLCRRRVVCHVHELGGSSATLFRLLRFTTDALATGIVCVSRFAADRLRFRRPERVRVVPNTLSPAEWATAERIARARDGRPRSPFGVLMVCSLKWYKGVDSFLALARRAREAGLGARFTLVLNCEVGEFERFAAEHAAPNTAFVRRPASVYAHYSEADLLLNLSHPEGWIETFGLTLLEAMACGVPVVSPVVGGCTELFEDGAGGWRIPSRDIEGLLALVARLERSPEAWAAASRAARRAALAFGGDAFAGAISSVAAGVADGPGRRAAAAGGAP